MDNNQIWARLPRWQRVPWYLVVLPALCLVGFVLWDPCELLVRDDERIPDDAEKPTDLAQRQGELDGFEVNGTLCLGDGGVLEFLYHPISDSGVKLQRLDRDGHVIWKQECDRLGVSWHKSYLHKVSVFIDGGTIRVISMGSEGTFVERLSLSSGRRLARSVRK